MDEKTIWLKLNRKSMVKRASWFGNALLPEGLEAEVEWLNKAMETD